MLKAIAIGLAGLVIAGCAGPDEPARGSSAERFGDRFDQLVEGGEVTATAIDSSVDVCSTQPKLVQTINDGIDEIDVEHPQKICLEQRVRTLAEDLRHQCANRPVAIWEMRSTVGSLRKCVDGENAQWLELYYEFFAFEVSRLKSRRASAADAVAQEKSQQEAAELGLPDRCIKVHAYCQPDSGQEYSLCMSQQECSPDVP